MKAFNLTKIALALLIASTVGCSSGSVGNVSFGQAPDGGGIVTIRDDGQPLSKSGDLADSLEFEAFDAAGNLVYGPKLVPLTPEMTFSGIPSSASYVQLDYLRNGGFLLFRAEVNRLGQATLVNASELPVDPHLSRWSIATANGTFELRQSVEGAPIGQVALLAKSDSSVRGKLTSAPQKLKGVCYSPSPINFSNKDAPAIGDLFWDTFSGVSNGQNYTVFNWYALWGSGPLGGTPYSARGDLDQIRALNCNCLRVYSGIARQLGPKGEVPAPGTGQLFTHKAFLDRCWNNGNNPIYVLVDIPMADACFRKDVPDLPAGTIAFWEANLRESVRQLKDHPAVIGFNMMNEKDADIATFPNAGSGDPNEFTEYFYSQSEKYARIMKQEAPDKLVGWALHDAPAFVKFASQKPVGNSYMKRLKAAGFDFWGINSYQTLSLSSILGNEDGSYANVPDEAFLPVLFTELGWPATGHREPTNDTLSIYEDDTTHQRTAATLRLMYPQALNSNKVLGTFYFEFQDEWWKQENPGDSRFNNYTWNGQPSPNPGFPNGFWDEEGFGLFSTRRTAPRVNNDNNFPGNGPVLPVDTLTERKPITQALRDVYK